MTGVVGELNVVYKGRHRRHQAKYFRSSAPCTWDNLLWMAKKYLDFSLNPFLCCFVVFFFLSFMVVICSTWTWLPHAWHMGS